MSIHNRYMRGHPSDFDTWARMTGDESWNYTNVLPYFKKLEDYHGYESKGKTFQLFSFNIKFINDFVFGYQSLQNIMAKVGQCT